MGFWGKRRDPVDEALRSARPVASDELVDSLTQQVVAATAPKASRSRGSRLAFGAAVTVFMVGTFASFGGLGYAATTADQANAKAQAPQSAASAQYDEETVPTPPTGEASVLTPPKSAQPVSVAGQSTAPQAASGTLPFTGIGLGATAALGTMLLLLGVMLRRREARE